MRSKYGLMPFVELNGEHLADSQLIMNALAKHFNIEEKLSPEELAVSHYLQRSAEKNTLILILREKLIHHTEAFIRTAFVPWRVVPDFVVPLVLPILVWQFSNRGKTLARNSFGPWKESEFRELLRRDLEHLRHFLGTKKFLFGDRPTTADATVFGSLAVNFFPPVPHYGKELLESSDFKAIKNYLERVRDEVWGKDFLP